MNKLRITNEGAMNCEDWLRNKVIENMLRAHERVCRDGSVVDAIRIAEFILKIGRKFNDKVFDFAFEDHKQNAGSPPNETE